MMRTKLLIGMLSAAIIGIVAGSYWCNRSAAQDTPATGKQLFDQLKKEQGANKDVVLPALPANSNGPPVVVDAPKPGAPEVAPTPPASPPPGQVTPQTAEPVPPLTPTIPSPATPASKATVTQAQEPQVEEKKPFEVVPPIQSSKPTPKVTPPSNGLPTIPLIEQAPKPSTQEPSIIKAEPLLTPPPDAGKPTFPSAPGVGGPPSRGSYPPPGISPFDGPKPRDNQSPPPPTGGLPPPMVVPQTPLVSPPQLSIPKNSPWSFQLDVADNQTTVTATVNKKHVFKIVCKHVDLQTERGELKAKGNVHITGDAMEGTCANLVIPLSDDRLVLEGSAEARIRTTTPPSYVSDVKPAQFELKGETLNLRVSELQAGRYIQTSLTQSPAGMSGKPAPLAPSPSALQWSPYGRLRQTKVLHGEQVVWCLEDSAGREMCRFVTREGGNLTEYVGRSISVHLEPLDKTMSRVTHIALP